jgi:hypothetical protein
MLNDKIEKKKALALKKEKKTQVNLDKPFKLGQRSQTHNPLNPRP